MAVIDLKQKLVYRTLLKQYKQISKILKIWSLRIYTYLKFKFEGKKGGTWPGNRPELYKCTYIEGVRRLYIDAW